MNSMLEKYLMKMAAGAGKAKGAAQWAMKEHPVATGLGVGGAGLGAASAMSEDDSLEGKLERAKHKLGGLVDEGSEGLQDLLKRIGLR